jgi:CheY-like chemotaxis protein
MQLVLLDAMLPEMDGFTLAQRILGLAGFAGHLVPMLTPAGHSHQALRCRDMGIGVHLSKPVTRWDLWQALQQVLGVPATAPQQRATASGHAPASDRCASCWRRTTR